MSDTKSKSVVKLKVPFSLDLRLIIAGVVTYSIFTGFFMGLIYLTNNILNTYYSEDIFNQISAGSVSTEQFMQYGSINSSVGFISGAALVVIMFFIIFAEWFSFHKMETYRNAAIWGGIWAAIFLVTDRVIDYFYSTIILIVSNTSGCGFMSVSTYIGPFYIVFLLLVAIIPMVMLFIHKLVNKFDK